MSKSPNLLLPALGFAALAVGVAYGVSTRNYKAEEAALAQLQAERAAEQAAAKAAEVSALEAQIAQVQEVAREEVRLAALSGGTLSEPAPEREGTFGLGREAHPQEIAAWDVDVLPDGRGLPEGSGDVWTGEEVFVDQCAACHGDFAEGVDNWPVLAGGFDTLADEDPVKTVGSYWPYLSTVFDYVHRSMPFGAAGTLTADETYAITAYILYSNDLVDDDFVLSHENFAEVEMYNADGFVVDDRDATEYAEWRAEPCMEDCKDEVEVTMRSVFLVETPPEGGSNSVMNPARDIALPSFTAAGPSFIPEATPQPVETAILATAPAEPEPDQGDALVATGEKLFRQCSTCHEVGPGARNKSGPHLNGLFGRVMGSVDGFRYSGGFETAMEEGKVWDEAELAAFLADPKGYMSGTRMSFRGLKTDEDQAAIAAYLSAASE
ncbi:MAG: c-type cytochrome [Paracoccaceae bacterium]|nr:c-type cytochrome [Paracoccaceae bacterium]